ncbi:uncharacterized protein BO97DRAFT_425990 [Aspergillus homomorphus CBS 101889]|uniref:Uncharacterized protein n=1 Tax=Aspergillus homomorphus (strain CBS 101889) TaxID=1450537 RepID=A0A395HU51_ASPHC|nr:hypothetical protein BO97DRAFT_425990 [Aspergillus homomorphus CBS 101889]RAL11039.1 hypothetical protein BO97DRAFT_425990 [Aspergillus homomorphus CBS 101889]
MAGGGRSSTTRLHGLRDCRTTRRTHADRLRSDIDEDDATMNLGIYTALSGPDRTSGDWAPNLHFDLSFDPDRVGRLVVLQASIDYGHLRMGGGDLPAISLETAVWSFHSCSAVHNLPWQFVSSQASNTPSIPSRFNACDLIFGLVPVGQA